MHRRVRQRYIVERWFRGIGFSAVAISILFLAFLLFNMASKGLGGFSHYEAALPMFVRHESLLIARKRLAGRCKKHKQATRS